MKNKIVIFWVSILICSSIAFAVSQELVTKDVKYEADFVERKISEYAAVSGKDGVVVPAHVYYDVILRKALWNLEDNSFSPLDVDEIKRMDSPRNSRFLEHVWSEMEEICRSVSKDGGEKSIVSNAERMDRISTSYDNMLDEYYERVVDSLTASAQSLVKERFDDLRGGESIGYFSIRIAEVALDDPSLGKKLIFDGCSNFSTIDVGKILEENKGLKLGDEELKMVAVGSQEN